MELVQYENGKRYIHGKSESVSKLIDFFYKYRKHLGYMTIEDTTDNNRTLATLGSPNVNHYAIAD